MLVFRRLLFPFAAAALVVANPVVPIGVTEAESGVRDRLKQEGEGDDRVRHFSSSVPAGHIRSHKQTTPQLLKEPLMGSREKQLRLLNGESTASHTFLLL